jgi:hypothetical protein
MQTHVDMPQVSRLKNVHARDSFMAWQYIEDHYFTSKYFDACMHTHTLAPGGHSVTYKHTYMKYMHALDSFMAWQYMKTILAHTSTFMHALTWLNHTHTHMHTSRMHAMRHMTMTVCAYNYMHTHTSCIQWEYIILTVCAYNYMHTHTHHAYNRST